ncbi:unnamed protein product [Owenia fusiformis]|uniref:ZP domain-containing protein n=1 Tax=Owenia fusiformis TaxID=6347 RepID=A0A8S4N7U6_OWEFU|nr:unnamed protein product [Owenia fusiformis]
MKLIALLLVIGMVKMVVGQTPATTPFIQFSCSITNLGEKQIYVRLDEAAGTPLNSVYADGMKGTCDFVKDAGGGAFWEYTFDVTSGVASADYAKCGMTNVGEVYTVRVITQEGAFIQTSQDYQFDVTDNACDFATITNTVSFTLTSASTSLLPGTSTLTQATVTLEVVGVATGGGETVLANGAVLNLQTYPDIKLRLTMTDNSRAFKGITVGRCIAYPSISPLSTNQGITITDTDGCGWLDIASGGLFDTTAKLVGSTSATDYIVETDTTMRSFHFPNIDTLYFECTYEFCTAGDLATKCDVTTCSKRKRRATNTTAIANSSLEKKVRVGYRVINEASSTNNIDPFEGYAPVANNGTPSSSSTVSCLQSLEFLVVVVILIILLVAAIGVAIFATFKGRQRFEKDVHVDHVYDNRGARH